MPFISSLLSLVAQPDGGFWRIHHFSFPQGLFVNNYIPKKVAKLTYATLKNILTQIRMAHRAAVIIKKNNKVAFQNILVVSHQQWVLEFQ